MSGRLLTGLQGLPVSALAVLAMATELAQGEPRGIVQGGFGALERATGLSERRTREIVRALEARGLIKSSGNTRARTLSVLVLRRSTAANATGATGDFRELRARVGGLQRAIKEAHEQRDRAEAEMHQLRRSQRLEANASLVGLLADLDHATDCVDVDCRRCLEISRKIDAAHPEYLAEQALAEQLEAAKVLRTAGAELLAAMRDQGVGAHARRATTARAFAALLGPG